MSTGTDDGDRGTEWNDDHDCVYSTVEITHVLTGLPTSRRGDPTTCTTCKRCIEDGERVSVEAITHPGWREWTVWSIKCRPCSSGQFIMEYGWFDQVLVDSTLVHVNDAATRSFYHAMSNVSFVDYSPRGEGYYVDRAAFPPRIRSKMEF